LEASKFKVFTPGCIQKSSRQSRKFGCEPVSGQFFFRRELPRITAISGELPEHTEEDEAELKRYSQLLRARRGALCLFVPARPEIYAPIDKDFGHFRRYTYSELRQKLQRAGFTIEHQHYFNFARIFRLVAELLPAQKTGVRGPKSAGLRSSYFPDCS
jgi:hypothetical protein